MRRKGRDFCSPLLALAFLLAATMPVLAQTAPESQAAAAAMTARQVSTSTWYVQGDSGLGSKGNRNFISNAGFVVTPAGVVVIDALGSPELARELAEQIPVPALDGVACAVRVAEAVAGLGFRAPVRGSFARPRPKPAKGLSPALNRWIIGE